jgi:hypothetical protein
MEFLIAMGIPTAITGLIVWFFKRYLDKKDREKEQREAEEKRAREEREKSTETLMVMIMKTSQSTLVLSEATAKAVQRIPDAKCNGDMTAALSKAAEIQKEQEQFLINQGVKHIFEN